MFKSYEDAYRRSLEDREGFWSIAAGAIHWDKKWDKVLDDSKAPFYRWFAGGKLNTCYNAIDYHVENGRKDQTAIIYDSPVTGTKQKITYGELLTKVAQFAGVLKSLGVEKGDRVVIYMPMIPEAAVAMFACARIGAIHSLVFGGFASNELAVRIEDAKPKIVLSASCGIEPKGPIPYKPLLDKAIELSSHKPEKCIIYQRPQVKADLIPGRDIDWMDALTGVEPAGCVSVNATDPLYILYTSGTTGVPKGVVRDNGGHAVALKWSMKYIYGVEPGDVYWAASDVGWVVGHSYIIYAPLLSGCTTIMYEGKPVGTPDPGAFWRVISEYGVKVLFTAPTAFRAIKKEDPGGTYLDKYDISCLKYLFLAGERLDPDTYHWASDLLRIPVVDHWWQTETGWAIAANCMGIEELPIKPGSPTKPVPGYDVRILNESGKEQPNGDEGVIGIRLPLPPGCLPTLWQKDDAYVKSYLSDYAGYYATGDGGYKDGDGYLYIMGRVDDVINVAGHRLSTGGMEEVVAKHPDVAECAVIGVEDQLKGQVPVGFVVLKAGSTASEEEIQKSVVAMVRSEIGALACLKDVAVVKRLPKTRSGKILRATMRKIADGQKFSTPSTIEDPAVLGEIEAALKGLGYPRG
ncbi:MAG: propionyl-CoA synthetase [Desulfomonilia bacterium]|jgi:propionyl-CoA synthetase|uniref:Propionyl-CoA synthetase n=1 Tax=anaerobic digester metagenome TaxID=1263854 RepID=A0A485M461_9ZZZZ|nr:propionyl-CoA synthetase [Pseudomonadota bacterium]HON39483.1 propionyl-CoA synthetase [Deltaproteobacteria bacterium]HPD22565.1 propionyl-CoA synthetase [Deltaproteobacteria bacterium]HRS57427.1 propionyl-CoA synthetase [Desulfomonilia bacterium]HRV36482.1 propionyl-CoA synthetase [Desulfomonilia bacterium]